MPRRTRDAESRVGAQQQVDQCDRDRLTGEAPKLTTGGGTSDGRFIAPLGAQVVELGVINSTIHKVNECVRVEDIDLLHAMYLGVMRRLLA